MSNTKVKRGPGRPKGSKNKVKTTAIKRGRGRPKGSKNKSSNVNVVVTGKRGRGRPPGSKNKAKEEVIELPYPNPIHESQRIENIRYIASFYQHSDGRPKMSMDKPKKRGRKAKLETFDPEKLLKEDLDSDKMTYTDKDIDDELGRMDAYRDLAINKDRY